MGSVVITIAHATPGAQIDTMQAQKENPATSERSPATGLRRISIASPRPKSFVQSPHTTVDVRERPDLGSVTTTIAHAPTRVQHDDNETRVTLVACVYPFAATQPYSVPTVFSTRNATR